MIGALIVEFLIHFFVVLGMIFAVMGNVGVLVFPDVYTRLQASSTCTTTSTISFILAALLYTGIQPMTGKLIVLLIFFSVSSPVGAHIVARFAWMQEIPAWRRRRTGAGGEFGGSLDG